MKLPRPSKSSLRRALWRAGRKLYALARRDGVNDPRVNGEYWLLARVLESRRRGLVLLDVGANRGDWTAKALDLGIGVPALHVHSFEPSATSRAGLERRFSGTHAVTIHPQAMSARAGEAPFYSAWAGARTSSLAPDPTASVERVSMTTVDDFVLRRGLGPIALLKIDAEGHDCQVLRGAEQTLREGRVEVVQFEYNWRWLVEHTSLRDVFTLVADKPYRVGKLVGTSIEFYAAWHFELDRYFENNYVLVREGSPVCALGATVSFDTFNVPRRDE